MGTESAWGFPASLVVVGLAMILVANLRLDQRLLSILIAALALRVAGSVGRHWVIFEVYRGSADARVYYDRARLYAERFWELDFSPFWDTAQWIRPNFLGTQFVTYPAAFVVQFIGPSLLGAFVIFSLLSFLGLIGFLFAFRNAYPHVPLYRYARWLLLFPALWFWPSSIGKEALLITGLGIAVWGFIGRQDRINWFLMLAGISLIVAVRPEVGAVVILSMVLAEVIPGAGGWTPRKVFQTGVLTVAGFVGIRFALAQIGLDALDFEGVQAYIDAEAGSATGRSDIGVVGSGLGNIPSAMINILLRPFPWEAGSVVMMFSAVEIWGFWALVWFRRKTLFNSLRNWRSSRLLRMAIPFILLYSILLGLMIANLGIIARQRIFLFPFLFVLLEAAPRIPAALASRRGRPPPLVWPTAPPSDPYAGWRGR